MLEWCAAFRERRFFTSDLQPFDLASALRKHSYWFHAVIWSLETTGRKIFIFRCFCSLLIRSFVFSPYIFFVLPRKEKLFDRWFSTLGSRFSSSSCLPMREDSGGEKNALAYGLANLIGTMLLQVFFPERRWRHIDVCPSSRESFKPLKSKNTEHFSTVSPHAVISTLLIFDSGLWLHQYKGVADTFYIGSRCWRMLKAKPFIDHQSVITICSIVASRDVQIPRLNKQTTNNSFQTAVAGIGGVVDRSLCECSVCVCPALLSWLGC